MEDATKINIGRYADFRTTVLLRDQLVSTGTCAPLVANEIAIQVKIKTLEEYTNEELLLVIVPFVEYLGSLICAHLSNGFKISDFCKIVSTLELEF